MKEGQTARFELELSHENVPVSWYKNDLKIHPSRTVVTLVDGKRHVLEIKEVTLDDICQIKAEAKGIPSMANLNVIGNAEKTHLSSSVLSILVSVRVHRWILLCLCVFPYCTSFVLLCLS